MSCREGSAGPKGWLWYQPTSDSPRKNKLWQIWDRQKPWVRVLRDPQHPPHPTPSLGVVYLLFHGTGRLGITQAGPAWEGSQHRQHWGGDKHTGG